MPRYRPLDAQNCTTGGSKQRAMMLSLAWTCRQKLSIIFSSGRCYVNNWHLSDIKTMYIADVGPMYETNITPIFLFPKARCFQQTAFFLAQILAIFLEHFVEYKIAFHCGAA